MDEIRDLQAFREHAEALEARIEAADAAGDAVPPEARLMLESLRDLARAVEGLQATMDEAARRAPPPDSPEGEHADET